MKKIPFILLYSRLFLALVTFLFAFSRPSCAADLVSVLIILAIATDIFDGILARRLCVSSEKMRSLDSKIDTCFWISVLFCIAALERHFFFKHLPFILALISTELCCQAYSYLKFQKALALHAYLAKLWALLMAASCIAILNAYYAEILFWYMFGTGILAQLETLVIISILPKWHSDIPSVLHALQIKKGRPIKRHKLFNG